MNKPEFEIRSEGDEYVFEGWASVFDHPYEVSGFTEEIRKGSFKRSLRSNPNTVLLINHEGLPIARTHAGTLSLSEDQIGLRVEAKLSKEDPEVQNIARKMQRGDLDGQMSFAFRAVDQEWSDDFSKRVILAAEITGGDVSIVTNGANPATTSSIRANDLTLEHRKARAEAMGREFRGAVVYARKASSGGPVYSRVLNEPSPLNSAEPSVTYWERLSALRDGKTGDPLVDARAVLDRGRNATIQRELSEHRERVAKESRERDYERLARERRMRQYGGC